MINFWIDCPICKVFMKQLRKTGPSAWSYRCPMCKSKFIVNRAPEKRQWILNNVKGSG